MIEKAKEIDTSKIIGYKIDKTELEVTNNDAILYALGIGFSDDPLDKKHLNFTYENSENFQCFPTMFGGHALKYNAKILTEHPYIPHFNMMSLLHGEQWTEIINNEELIIPENKYYIDAELIDFEDKGSGTIFLIACNIYNEESKIILIVKSVLFIRDIKGHKYKSINIINQKSIPTKIPNEAANNLINKIIYKTNKNQAILYRIGGKDLNPLHIDSQMSSLGGFKTPILHGMCFYGIVAKALYEKLTNNNVLNLSYFNARFTSHVYPGETLIIFIYKSLNNKYFVKVTTKERDKQVLIGEASIITPKF